MVSKVTCTSVEAAEAYFDKHLANGDYFIGKERTIGIAPTGVWHGVLAVELHKIGQAVTREDFRAFLRCDLVSMGGREEWKRLRASELKYVEFTYTAPKAFSVAAALDTRLKGELVAAVREELTWFESAAAARDRRGNLSNGEVTTPTGNMLAALFEHETSRTNDPNFHVHALIGNMTLDRERGQVLALHYGDMLELRKTLDARIHNNIALRLSSLGYHVEIAEHGFALGEVPREAVELFSVRHRQVEAVKRLLLEGYASKELKAAISLCNASGIPLEYDTLRASLGAPTGAQIGPLRADETAVLLTRPEKVEITTAVLKANTQQKLATAGLKVVIPSPTAARVASEADLPEAIKRGITAVFEKQSVARLDELVGEIVRLAPGAASNAEVAHLLRSEARFLVARMATPDRPGGVDLVTTRMILHEEHQMLLDVASGLGSAVPPITTGYSTPAILVASKERIAEMVKSAAAKGEILSSEMARAWLEQFGGIHEYFNTSTDRFLNIRGGAGVGKTFCLEILVGDSLRAGRNVVLMAPYGEQSRLTMWAEVERLVSAGKLSEAAAFREANTVSQYLLKMQTNAEFRASLRGADIFVDEAGLLDTPTAAALVRAATRNGARIIFQGDTEQKLAVGRGSPLEVLQERLKLGMHVERANISRRQLAAQDKKLAQDLSSGDGKRFSVALEQYIDRGDVMELKPEMATLEAAKYVVEARSEGKDVLVFASVHRLCDGISEEIHRAAMKGSPKPKTTELDVWKAKDLQDAEKRSPHFYSVGNAVEWKTGVKTISGIVSGIVDGKVKVGEKLLLDLTKVTDVYERKQIVRGLGAHVVLSEKIKHGSKVYERNSRHEIKRIGGGFVTFGTGLRLATNDGRLKQGDVLTVDKAQGAKGKSVLWVEDNRSLMAMSNKRDVHVGFTRHVEQVKMLVESISVFRELAVRDKTKISATTFAESAREAHWSKIEARALNVAPAAKQLRTPSASALSKSARTLSARHRGLYRRVVFHKIAVLCYMHHKYMFGSALKAKLQTSKPL
jgi:conjugative relaxase-like TrwC/TraI family protein